MSDRDVRAQVEPLGVGLLMALTVFGALAAMVFGAGALADTQRAAELDQASQAMTQFDSTAAQVALGESAVQSVTFGGYGGDYRIRPSQGHVDVTHYNYDGNGTNHTLYEGELGAIVYTNDGRTIAYQGGGVWASDGDGNSRLVSPPEFHYREATLTFPIVRVNGQGGASGEPTAVVRRTEPSNVIYPADTTYPNGKRYDNPQVDGKVKATIRSQYYEAWADYFRQRTEGTVTVDPPATPGGQGQVTVELVSLGTGAGHFDMPREGEALELRGLAEGHAVNDFNITVRPSQEDSADFNNLQWALYAEDGQQELEIYLRQNSGGECDSLTADAVFYYTDDGGETFQGWVAEEAFRGECDADGNVYLTADFTNATKTMTYTDTSDSSFTHSKTPAKPQNGDHIGTVDINPHGHGTKTYNETETEGMAFLLRHYVGNFGGEIDLEVYDKNGGGGSVSESGSAGTITYAGSGQFVTFLQVSENEIDVEFK